VNGWQLSQITTIASPQFATATARVSGSPYPGAPFNTTVNGYGGTFRVPFIPYNTLKVDSIQRVDARLSRELPLSERVKMWLNFEAFNVFNNVYNTGVATEAYSVANGVFTPTRGLGAGTQARVFRRHERAPGPG
jgi:hypothetical protein